MSALIICPDDIAEELMNDLTGKVGFLYNEIPTIVPANDASFAVCSVGSMIIPKGAYSYTIASIDIFVKNLANGTHNGKKLKVITDAISEIFPIKSDKYLFNIFPTVIPMGNDNKGYNVTRIQIETFIYNK